MIEAYRRCNVARRIDAVHVNAGMSRALRRRQIHRLIGLPRHFDSCKLPRLLRWVAELLNHKSRAVRTVLRWQLIATVVLASVAWPWTGVHGSSSALLGGLINSIASLAYFTVVGLGATRVSGHASGTIHRLIRAEAIKLLIIVGALWFSLSYYKGLIVVPFFAAFIATALASSMALLARDDSNVLPTPLR